MDAFVRDVRDLFGVTYWRYPPRSTERSAVLTLSRMFDSRLLVGLRGPRVSPRQISRGYQAVVRGVSLTRIATPTLTLKHKHRYPRR